jgi:hypothetical protein
VSVKGTKDELQVPCKNKYVQIEEELDEVVQGWEEKPKGTLQFLWERGFIDPATKKEEDAVDPCCGDIDLSCSFVITTKRRTYTVCRYRARQPDSLNL